MEDHPVIMISHDPGLPSTDTPVAIRNGRVAGGCLPQDAPQDQLATDTRTVLR